MTSKKKIDFLFYCPQILTSPFLDSIDSLHCVKVLRKKNGDVIFITDGASGLYECSIIDANTKACKLSVIQQSHTDKESIRKVNIAICPTKNADRIEYFLEKCVEIGVNSVHFVMSDNTYPKKMNMERLKKIAVSAMKQSLKTQLPVLFDPIKFKDFIKSDFGNNTKFMAHLDHESENIIRQNFTNDVLILIGPEGDFSTEEIAIASKNNFKKVTLGTSRLRTETAGIVAVSLLNLLP